MALAKIIGAIYEPVFLDCIYGFRPGRGCHDALWALNWGIEKRKTQWVLDAWRRYRKQLIRVNGYIMIRLCYSSVVRNTLFPWDDMKPASIKIIKL